MHQDGIRIWALDDVLLNKPAEFAAVEQEVVEGGETGERKSREGVLAKESTVTGGIRGKRERSSNGMHTVSISGDGRAALGLRG